MLHSQNMEMEEQNVNNLKQPRVPGTPTLPLCQSSWRLQTG